MFGLRPLSRYVSYLHVGNRVPGLKRDPLTYMISPTGIKYTDFKNDIKFVDQIRSTLKLDDYRLKLDDKTILQCFTHKSFAHGFVPYNEKLSLVGAQYLKLILSIRSVQNTSGISPINKCNFDKLGSLESKNELNNLIIYNWLKKMKLNDLIFWKKKSPSNDPVYNGEPKIISTVLHSIIGALVLTNEEINVSKYLEKFLLDKKSKTSFFS